MGERVHEADLLVPAITSAFIRLAQGVVDVIWLDLGALFQGYNFVEIAFFFKLCNKNMIHVVLQLPIQSLKLVFECCALTEPDLI